MKEFFRKKLVSLKRKPQIITLIVLMVACAIFTFNLGVHSQAAINNYSVTSAKQWALTEYAQEHFGGEVPALYRIPGLYAFVLTLFSILTVISYLSVYKRGKLNVFMLCVVYFMLVAMVVCDIMYVKTIDFYTNPTIGYNAKGEADVAGSVNGVIAHLVANIVGIVFVTILPLIRKLLNKIDTSVEDEYDKLIESKTEEELLIDEEA